MPASGAGVSGSSTRPPNVAAPADSAGRADDPATAKLREEARGGCGPRTRRSGWAPGPSATSATAAALGDYFQYVIDHPVTLARQKSALLPIVGKDIEGTRLSIYNESVQAKHPLLGLRFKNTSGAHLNQGPITVFEGSVYAGDTRVLDVQPNEERLLSYAIDLGTEVDPKAGAGTQKITSVKAVKGIVTTVTKVTDEKTYKIVNRSQTDRTLLDRAPEPHQPAVQAGRYPEAGGRYARSVPVPDAGQGR